MLSSFRVFASTIAGLTTLLFLVLLLAPEFIISLFGMEQAVAASDMGRRAAMLFAGYTAMLWSVSNAPHSAARQSILCGITTMMLGLAFAGVFEFQRGAAKWPIVLASVGETAWAVWAIWLFTKFGKAEKVPKKA